MWLAVSKLRHEWRDTLLGGFVRTANFPEDESLLVGVRFAIGSGSESLGRQSWSSCWRHLMTRGQLRLGIRSRLGQLRV